MSSYLVSYFRIRVVMWLVILKDQSGYVHMVILKDQIGYVVSYFRIRVVMCTW